MKKILLLLLALVTIQSLFAQKSTGRRVIFKVVADLEKFNKAEFPRDTISDHPLGSFSEEDLLRRYKFQLAAYQTLEKIDQNTLPFNDKINLELLKHEIKNQLTYFEYQEYLNPILSDDGFHIDIAFIASNNYKTKKSVELYIQKLNAIPKYTEQHLALIAKGLQVGISQPKVALKGYESTYEQHIVDDVTKSVFWKPFTTKPYEVSDADWEILQKEGKKAIFEQVIPSFLQIKTFFDNEYYPKTRTTLGASNFPNGNAYYAEKVKFFTTTNLTPNEVYNIGLSEVERIKKEMYDVMKEVNFTGSLKDFIQTLRTDPKFYPTSAEGLLKEASYIAKKIDGKLPLLFGKLPRQPYGVVPVPDFLAPSYTGGRYSGASINSTRSGSYWVNTYNLNSRTLYTLEALTLHEAVPGHHLQSALTQELTHLPKFRQNLYINAFGEGWGLYSEYLGTELGLFKDPYSRFGKLTYEMWRACRLVIDVGIHEKNWSREQAVNYLADNTALSLHEVNTEINRYICWPGQALAYKMGEIKIKELRKRAENQLKDKFDVRAFHDLILSEGTVTLSILDKMVDRYIAAELTKIKK
ncbi:DUF885 domain-containing protein [Emticicia sp. SJ17W-69]|uniref:DUF885 domain-containing protein n=1 Tax=Emticicia sp. SJ17W-69 TaxID=3421657 RepID=UPI003EC14E0F